MRTYLDTSVLIAAFKGEQNISDEALKYIDNSNLEFVVSDFLKIELLPMATFFKRQKEVDFYTEYFKNASTYVQTSSAIVNNAYNLACQFGLGGADAIHYESSVASNVSQFVTAEKSTKPFFKINNPNIKVISILI